MKTDIVIDTNHISGKILVLELWAIFAVSQSNCSILQNLISQERSEGWSLFLACR